jgi:hypothetical protein
MVAELKLSAIAAKQTVYFLISFTINFEKNLTQARNWHHGAVRWARKQPPPPSNAHKRAPKFANVLARNNCATGKTHSHCPEPGYP